MKCDKCGSENDPDSKFCKSCGNPLGPSPGAPSPPPPPPPGDFGREMSDMGRRMGEDFRRAGERFGKEMDRRGNEFGVWWDTTLGIFSPLVVALFGIVAFFVVLLLAGAIGAVSDHPAFWNDLAYFMEHYWWLFFALSFLGAFQGYFMRRYKRDFIWVNPVLNGIGSVAWFWILAQVLRMFAVDYNHPRIGDLAEFVEDVLLVIFILVVILSYLFAFWRSGSPSNWDRKEK